MAERGILLEAGETTNGATRGVINADIDNLQVSGDWEDAVIAADSIMIDVLASGAQEEYSSSGGAPSRIPVVNLEVNGSILDGSRKASGGWGIGIHARAFGTQSQQGEGSLPARNYSAGYDVEVRGTTISQMVNNGVYAVVDCDARGRFSLTSMSVIKNIGDVNGPNFAPNGVGAFFRHSGGYLSARMRRSSVLDNLSHGVMLRSGALFDDFSCIPQHGLPEGLHIDFEQSSFFGNEGNGIFASAGATGNPMGDPIGGIVGGARYGGPSAYTFDSTSWMDYPGGQGSILGCVIRHNAGDGIGIQVEGLGVAHFRTVRSVIYGNEGDGWDATLGGFLHQSSSIQPQMACPILFCTIAGNDGFSANITESPVSGINPDFSLETNGTGILHTKFFGTVFAKKDQSVGNDFGGWLATSGNLELDTQQSPYFSNIIYANSCRSHEDISGHTNGITPMYDWSSYADFTETYATSWLGPIGTWNFTDPLVLRFQDFPGGDVGFGDAWDLPPGFTLRPRSVNNWLGNLGELEQSELDYIWPGLAQSPNAGTVDGTQFGVEVRVNKGAFHE